jgi:hypothetical protein
MFRISRFYGKVNFEKEKSRKMRDLDSYQSHYYHITHRADADAEKRVALPYVKEHHYGASEKLGKTEGCGTYLRVLEAVDEEHTHNCVRKYTAEPGNKSGRAALSAENEEGYAAQKVRYGGADENY